MFSGELFVWEGLAGVLAGHFHFPGTLAPRQQITNQSRSGPEEPGTQLTSFLRKIDLAFYGSNLPKHGSFGV